MRYANSIDIGLTIVTFHTISFYVDNSDNKLRDAQLSRKVFLELYQRLLVLDHRCNSLFDNTCTPSVHAVGQSGYSLLWSFRFFLIIAASVNQRFIAIKQKGCCAVMAESLFVKLTFPWQSFLSHFLLLLILSNLA